MTMTKHTPATPLPWTWRTPTGVTGMTDLQYAAHAANAYPKLVEALRGLMEQYVGDRSRENVIGPAGLAADNARSLLKSLGEE